MRPTGFSITPIPVSIDRRTMPGVMFTGIMSATIGQSIAIAIAIMAGRSIIRVRFIAAA